MGSIIASSSSLSVVRSVELFSEQFSSKGLPCSYCLYSRYLTCINSTCQCPSGTHFDGSICHSQNLLGGQCINEMDCRIDLNFTCLPRQQCGRKFYPKNMIDFSYMTEFSSFVCFGIISSIWCYCWWLLKWNCWKC